MTRAGKIPSLAVVFAALLLTAAAIAAPTARADFGFTEVGLGFSEEGGAPTVQAGVHPLEMTQSFAFKTTPDAELGEEVPDEALKDLTIELPLGTAGAPKAVPPCSIADFTRIVVNKVGCPDSSAVGIVDLNYAAFRQPPGVNRAALYSLVPPPGALEMVGFKPLGLAPIFAEVHLSTKPPFNPIVTVTNSSNLARVYGLVAHVWGNPLSPTHDPERGACAGVSSASCPVVGLEAKPFLIAPRSCSGPLAGSFEADSWQKPNVSVREGAQSPGLNGCEKLGFDPSIESRPTSTVAESPSGLDFNLDITDPNLLDVSKEAGSDVERAVVTLPAGVTTNPSVASGLQACSQAQYESESLETLSGTGCPEASKVGSVEVETPLLEEKVLHGAIYVARQGDSEFHNLLTLYMVIKDPELGILIRQAGKVEPNASTGQLTTTFDQLPQLPFSHFHLHFRTGERAPLITPPTCGSYSTTADLYPYADPGVPVHLTSEFKITSGANGGACASASSQLPNSPTFSAGTLNPAAGAYSPFVLNLSRADGSQQLSSISTTLPEGLLGKLAGIPYCSDAQIAQAQSRGDEFQGAIELASPSCPQASEVGTVNVGSGAGGQPYYVGGHAYLAGPYKGAPLSLEIITPAIAGPFDLGVVAVRTALQVDPLTAQITAVSDPIPTILHGLPLDVRSISLDMSRPNFTLNPTSCEPKSITGSVTSVFGDAPLSQYFQASNCAALAFRPKLALSLKGQTKRAGHPTLKAVLTYPKGAGYANIGRAQVSLPHSEFLDQGNLNKVCTQAQLKSASCPSKSIYGKAKAWTPLLEKPLEGNVYLGVGFGYKLPALVAELGGQIRVLLKGKIDTDKQKGIRTTFEAVPDAPVEKFVLEMKGGKKYGLLENSEDICRKKQQAGAVFVAQNGKTIDISSTIANSCGAKKGGKGKKRARSRRG